MSKTLAVFLGITALFLGLIITAAVVMMSFTNKLIQPPETFTVGREFISALSTGDYEGASALAISQLQNPEAMTQLEILVSENSDLLNSNTQVSLTGRGIDNDLRYAYGTISSNGVEAPLYMEFVDEDGETRVSYFSFNADDIPNSDDSSSADSDLE
jgi:hypothetical protein